MDPKTLPEDIFAILDPDNNHEVDEANVEWAGEVFKAVLRNRFKKREERRGERVITFSSLGKKDRALWYAANKPETAEKMPPKQYFKFLYGDAIEVLMLFLAKEAGHTVTHEQHRVQMDGVGGYTDCVIDGIPVDAKSASAYSYAKFDNGSFVFDDPFGYIPQLSGYAHALEEDDTPVVDATKRAGFLVADKVNGGICFAEIDELTIKGNAPKPRIKHLKEVVSQTNPPPRCYDDVAEGKSGNRKLGINCSYCPFKDDCWSDANDGEGLKKYFYSRGPVWLTKVVRTPKVEEAT